MTGESSWLTTVQPVRPSLSAFMRRGPMMIEAGFDESPYY
jgi:hypothetical protein